MKLFVLLSRVPYPLEKGDKLRAYQQLKILNKQHEIHLCCLHDSKTINEETENQLKQICHKHYIIKLNIFSRLWSIILGCIKGNPIQVSYFYQKQAKKKIDNILFKINPEHIYIQLIRTSEYVKNYRSCGKTIDYMDALSAGFQKRFKDSKGIKKIVFGYEYKSLKKYENNIFESFNHKTIISEPDRNQIQHSKKENILIIPNGVHSPDENKYKGCKVDFDIVFTGNMQYAPNVDAAIFLVKEIMPIVWKTNNTVKVLISGATPTKQVLSLASSNVRITGWVEDIYESYARSKMFIAPMRLGSGLQNKLLEAMSMKKPCVTTPVANNSLQAIHDENILVGTNKEELAHGILQLLTNKELSEKIGVNGQIFVTEHYNWKSSTNKLNSLFSVKIK